MGYGMKDWQVTLDGVPVGTLGEMQGFDDLMDFGLRHPEPMNFGKSMEITCTLRGVTFKRLLKATGIKEQWLEYAHEWSAKCQALRRKLKARWKR